MSELIFAPPGPDEPGYLLRSRKALQFKERQAANNGTMDLALLDEMVDFLAVYVKEPVELAAKREALMMASENQFMQLLDLLAGMNSKNSSAGTKSRRLGNTAKGSR